MHRAFNPSLQLSRLPSLLSADEPGQPTSPSPDSPLVPTNPSPCLSNPILTVFYSHSPHAMPLRPLALV